MLTSNIHKEMLDPAQRSMGCQGECDLCRRIPFCKSCDRYACVHALMCKEAKRMCVRIKPPDDGEGIAQYRFRE